MHIKYFGMNLAWWGQCNAPQGLFAPGLMDLKLFRPSLLYPDWYCKEQGKA